MRNVLRGFVALSVLVWLAAVLPGTVVAQKRQASAQSGTVDSGMPCGQEADDADQVAAVRASRRSAGDEGTVIPFRVFEQRALGEFAMAVAAGRAPRAVVSDCPLHRVQLACGEAGSLIAVVFLAREELPA